MQPTHASIDAFIESKRDEKDSQDNHFSKGDECCCCLGYQCKISYFIM